MLLRVHVKRVLQSENGLASFECRIDDEIGQIASANLSVFQPAEDALPDQGTA
jgi:predicted hotdog family 3-hydroxylacyl-ACP dehydratase